MSSTTDRQPSVLILSVIMNYCLFNYSSACVRLLLLTRMILYIFVDVNWHIGNDQRSMFQKEYRRVRESEGRQHLGAPLPAHDSLTTESCIPSAPVVNEVHLHVYILHLIWCNLRGVVLCTTPNLPSFLLCRKSRAQ